MLLRENVLFPVLLNLESKTGVGYVADSLSYLTNYKLLTAYIYKLKVVELHSQEHKQSRTKILISVHYLEQLLVIECIPRLLIMLHCLHIYPFILPIFHSNFSLYEAAWNFMRWIRNSLFSASYCAHFRNSLLSVRGFLPTSSPTSFLCFAFVCNIYTCIAHHSLVSK